MRIVLEITEGPAAGRKKALRGPVTFSVGRSESADWTIAEDAAMSSSHFQMELTEDGCFVVDLGSTNGTLVNGVRVGTQSVIDGQTITAGLTVFTVAFRERAVQSNRPPLPPRAEPDAGGDPSAPAASVPVESVVRETQLVRESEAPISNAPGAVNTSVPSAGKSAPIAATKPPLTPLPPKKRPGDDRVFAGAVIEVVSEHEMGRKLILRSGQMLTAGRTEQSDFVLNDPTMSATHFQITSVAGGWQLKDLKSSSGTTVNGQDVATTLLNSGDRILAGRTEFVVKLGRNVVTEGSSSHVDLPFQEGVRDEDARVRRAALEAAAWCKQPWLLDHCRKLAATGDVDADTLYMLAVLGQPTDVSAFQNLVGNADLGPARYSVLGTFGHPAIVPVLLDAIAGDDPKCAEAAGIAFRKITGVDVMTGNRAEVPADDADPDDEFQQEFPDEAFVPDPAKANAAWQQLAPNVGQATRLQQGEDVGGDLSAAIIGAMDMQSKWELAIRASYSGKAKGSPAELQRFSF